MNVDLNGSFLVATDAAETYAFITTPERFAPILPYFKTLKYVNGGDFGIVLEVGVPQIRGQADITVRRVEEVPSERVSYELSGRHALGMIDARMSFTIAPADQGAEITWTSHAVVSGTLASLAQGILLPLAKRQIKTLVASVQDALGPVGESTKPSPGLLKRSMSSMLGLFGANAAPSAGETNSPEKKETAS